MQTNMVMVTGTVRGAPKHYRDTGKTVFTLECDTDRFYVETMAAPDGLTMSTRVFVMGKLFSRQGHQRDWAGIQANFVAPVGCQLTETVVQSLLRTGTNVL